MKSKAIKIIIPVLCAALIFAGCALAYAKTSGTKQTLPTEEAVTNTTAADDGTIQFDLDWDETEPETETKAETETEPEKTTTKATASDVSSDLFSERDLSAAYDDETITVQLTGSGAAADSDKVTVSGTNVVISGAGTYLISGTLENGSIIVDAGKDDKVQLVLSGASIHSETYAAIYVKQADKVFITLKAGTDNTLSNGGAFTQQDENNVDAVIFSKDDVTLNGTGSLTVTSPAGHGIVGKDEVTITGGVYKITAAKCVIRANDSIAIADGTFTFTAGTDGLHAENDDDETLGNIYITGGTFTVNAKDDAIHANTLLQIDGGSFDITGAEGLEATYIKINDGIISVSASDDGVNAAKKSSAYTPTVEINGGTLTVVMGAGDTDGVDSNGNLIITGGTVNVTGNSAFDYDGTVSFTGGTVIINGQQVSTIPNQMMGGGMRGGMTDSGMQGDNAMGGGMMGGRGRHG